MIPLKRKGTGACLAYNPVGSYLANDVGKKLPMPWPFSARARSLTRRKRGSLEFLD